MFAEWNVKEIPGKSHNPRILKYFDEIGHEWVDDDETAWCSAFANWVCMMAGARRSHELNARSWLKYDVGFETSSPVLGDIVVLWRDQKDSWKGHVGFYIREDDNYIYVLGGNQDNKVCILPYRQDRLLAYKYVL